MEKEKDIMLYNDYHEGQLVYVTEDGRGIIEQADIDGQADVNGQADANEAGGHKGLRFIVKLYFSEFEPWNKLATELLADIKEMQRWALAKDGWKDLKVNPMFVDRIFENEKYAKNDERQRTLHTDDDLRDYRLFQAWKLQEDGWRIYENDQEYLFMWQGNVRDYNDFADELADSAWRPIRFLRAWFDRVNGIASDK